MKHSINHTPSPQPSPVGRERVPEGRVRDIHIRPRSLGMGGRPGAFPLFLALVLLSGGTSLALEFPKPGSEAKSGELVLAGTNLPAGPATLGTLTVPENRDRPGRLIYLPLVVLHSKAKTPQAPIFIFQLEDGSRSWAGSVTRRSGSRRTDSSRPSLTNDGCALREGRLARACACPGRML